jgi:Spy/CpxP family protein refolding chaperone
MRKVRGWVAAALVALSLLAGAGAALAGGGKSGSAHDPVNPQGHTRGWAKDHDADKAAKKAAREAEKAARDAAKAAKDHSEDDESDESDDDDDQGEDD